MFLVELSFALLYFTLLYFTLLYFTLLYFTCYEMPVLSTSVELDLHVHFNEDRKLYLVHIFCIILPILYKIRYRM